MKIIRPSYLFINAISLAAFFLPIAISAQADLPSSFGFSDNAPIGWTESLGSSNTRYSDGFMGQSCRFDATGDYLMVQFNGVASDMSFHIKGESPGGSTWQGTFSIQASVNGVDWMSFADFGIGVITENFQLWNFDLYPGFQFIRFYYTDKISGFNVSLDEVFVNSINGSPYRPVTFYCNMSNEVVSSNGVHLAGSFGSGGLSYADWDPNGAAMVLSSDNIYTTSLFLATDVDYTFRAVNGNAISYLEPLDCPEFVGNRVVSQGSSEYYFCFGQCGNDINCSPEITFRCNMSNQTSVPSSVHLIGDFQGWDATDPNFEMFDPDGDLIYEITTVIYDSYINYKYVNGDQEETFSSFNDPCIYNGYRESSVHQGQIIEDCFESCYNYCINPAPITFIVDLSYQTVSPDGVWLIGDFTSPQWENGALQLTDIGGGLYSSTIVIGGGSAFQYKFVNGNVFNQSNHEQLNIPEFASCDSYVDIGGSVTGEFNRIYWRQDVADTIQFCFDQCVVSCSTALGCNDQSACNYDFYSTFNDGSCMYIGDSCDDGNAQTYYDVITNNFNCNCQGLYYSVGGWQGGSYCSPSDVDYYIPTGLVSNPSFENYQIQYYYKEGIQDCPPMGSNDLSGWTLAEPVSPDQPQIILADFLGVRTYKAFIVPAPELGIAPQWMGNCNFVTIYESPEIIITPSTSECLSEFVEVALTNNEYINSYYWSTGESTPSISIAENGIYSVSLGIVNGGNSSNCYGIVNDFEINLSPIEDYLPICLVTVDPTTGFNSVVWQPFNSDFIELYRIFKETDITDEYVAAGEVQYGLDGIYSDPNSNSAVQASRYKIELIDACGTSLGLSDPHKTIHLTSNLGVNNSVNLIWTHYEGIDYGSYNIYRGTDINNMSLLGSVASNISSYTDLIPLGANTYYMIEVDGISCDPTRDLVTSRSNIVQNSPISITERKLVGFDIYPNPTSDYCVLKFDDSMIGIEYDFYNSLGQLISKHKINSSSGKLDLKELTDGIYYIKIDGTVFRIVKSIQE